MNLDERSFAHTYIRTRVARRSVHASVLCVPYDVAVTQGGRVCDVTVRGVLGLCHTCSQRIT